MAISQTTDAYVRTYTDNGQVTAYVEWVDHRGRAGRTGGPADNAHMQALISRAEREGHPLRKETW